jgi:hypothetical protein
MEQKYDAEAPESRLPRVVEYDTPAIVLVSASISSISPYLLSAQKNHRYAKKVQLKEARGHACRSHTKFS